MNALRHAVLAVAILTSGALYIVAPRARAQAPAAAASPAGILLKQAREAETAYQFDVALDRLYTLELEQPRSADALTGRLLLARLLTLVGDLPAAILQAQALGDELPAGNRPERQQALDLATAAGRRLRSIPIKYTAPEIAATKGLVELKEPTAIVPTKDGSFIVVDRAGKKLFRMADDGLTAVALTEAEPSAVAQLPDGTLLIGVKPEKNKNGSIVSQPAGKPVPTTFTEGGKMKPLTKVMSMAVNSLGDVFIVADDYSKGLLRCKVGATDCAPWGPTVELKTVKIGPSDFVYLLDSKEQTVRVFDNSGREMGAVGPTLDAPYYAAGVANATGATLTFKRITDFAVDQTYALYLLDPQQRKIGVVPLRLEGEKLVAQMKGEVEISSDDKTPFGMKGPSAIAVTPSGALILAGTSTSRLVRFR